MYYIGIDGGGSFSRLVAVDEKMQIICRQEGKSTNIASIGYDGVLENIKSLFAELNSANGMSLAACQGICIGTAGVGLTENARLMEQIFRSMGYIGKLKIITDGELVLIAESKGAPGVAVISGTGSIAYAMDGFGNTLRAGGWGHLIDDEGSGYGIGIDAIKCALMDIDGRGEKTILTDMIVQHFNLERIDDVLKYVYGADFTKARIAEAALLVYRAFKDGDRVAALIQDRAAAALVALATALIEKTGLDKHKIVISGSVLLQNSDIRSKFCTAIAGNFPGMKIVERNEDPEVGAAHLAARL